MLLALIAFIAFSLLFDLGYVGSQQMSAVNDQNTSQNNGQNDNVQNIPLNNAPASVVSQTSVQSTNTSVQTTEIDPSDKAEIITAILSQDTVLRSGNAADIRSYLSIGAMTNYIQQLSTMSDSDILAMASSTLAGDDGVTTSIMNSPQTIFQLIGDSTAEVTIMTSNGPVARISHKVNGVWY